MYPISSEIMNLFETEHKQVLRITGTDRDGTAITITDANVLMNGFNVDRYSCNGDKLEVGTAIAAELTLRLDNRQGQYNNIIFEGAELFVEVGVFNRAGQNPTVVYIPCGYFTSYEQPRSFSTITIHALDRMAKLDVVPPSPMPWTDGNGNVMTTGDGEPIYFMVGIVTPSTIAGIVQQACERCGVTIATDLTTLPNYNFVISEMPALQTQVSYRNIIQWCAGIMGTNAWMDWNGNLRFTWYDATTNYVATTANRFSSDLYENDITITGVSYTNTQNATIIAGENDYTIDLTGNYLASAGVSQILPAIKNVVAGFTYRPFSASVVNAPYLWPMDMIKFNKDGVDHDCAVTNVNFGINGDTSLQGKGETAQTNSGIAPNGVTSEQGFLIEKAINAAVDTVDKSLDQEAIFNILTNNGQIQGLILYNGRVYLNADYIRTGTISADLVRAGTLNGEFVSIINLDASNITAGTLNGNEVSIINLDADNITAGTLDGENVTITNLDASNIITGTLDGEDVNIVNLNADNITAGTLDGEDVNIVNLNADNITTGTISNSTGVTTWDLDSGTLQNTGHTEIIDEETGTVSYDYYNRSMLDSGDIKFYSRYASQGERSYIQRGGLGDVGNMVALYDSRTTGSIKIGTGSSAKNRNYTEPNKDASIYIKTNSSTQSTIWLHSTRIGVCTSSDGGPYYAVVGPTRFTTADGKTVTVRNGLITDIS